MANAINWFEIPAKTFEKAKSFYETILGIEIQTMPHPSFKYGIIPADIENGHVGGRLVEGDGVAMKAATQKSYYAFSLYSICAVLAIWFPLAIAILVALSWIIWLFIGINIKG